MLLVFLAVPYYLIRMEFKSAAAERLLCFIYLKIINWNPEYLLQHLVHLKIKLTQ